MPDNKPFHNEIQAHSNKLQEFLISGLVRFEWIDFIRMEIAAIERETGIKPQT